MLFPSLFIQHVAHPMATINPAIRLNVNERVDVRKCCSSELIQPEDGLPSTKFLQKAEASFSQCFVNSRPML